MHRESKGTGYYNAIMPKQVVQTSYIPTHLPPPLLNLPNNSYVGPNLSYYNNSSTSEIIHHNKPKHVYAQPTQFTTLPG